MAKEFSKKFYDSKEWREVRDYVMHRDHFTCVKCGAVAEEVHHKIHLREDNMDDVNITLNPENLQSLCKDCHFAEHKLDNYEGKLEARGIPKYEYCFDENGFLVRKEKKE